MQPIMPRVLSRSLIRDKKKKTERRRDEARADKCAPAPFARFGRTRAT